MDDAKEDLTLTQTLTGRLRNFPLAPSPENAMYGVYEAVSNSLHAIQDQGDPARGQIVVSVFRSVGGEVEGFSVADTGVGLNAGNFSSFRRIDSTTKAVRGGKLIENNRVRHNALFEKLGIS
ncbi:hypothetical protein ACO2Q0_16500 [Phenylobacterium sp. VNQ135]|uniref:hypothetical protein n=1 Tax=Phenylobacterium sp. VNQ135 TaxID=3400922 RepID=UPI003C0D241F